MKTLLKILSVMANISIITGLVHDTYRKTGFGKKPKTDFLE